MSTNPLSARPYDLILLGATGYTGKYCAEHITTHLPTDLKWAVAGRSTSKLQSIVSEIRSLNPDRTQPGIEECPLEAAPLNELAKKTKVLVNCIGPYALYGEPVLKACVNNGTGYIDTTGEIPWVLKMVRKYHKRAKETGAIIIPQCGFESTASDLLTFSTLSRFHAHFSQPATTTTTALHTIRGSASGGTLLTIFTALELFSARELLESTKPWILSPIGPPPESVPLARSLISTLTGTNKHELLGSLGPFPMAGANSAIVQRSWGLLSPEKNSAYGPEFSYSEHLSVRSRLLGLGMNVLLGTVVVLLTIPPIRWVLKRLVTQPGSGADKESAKKEGFEFRCVAEGEGKKRVMGKMGWEGGIYQVTAVYMCEAAATVLGHGREGLETAAHEIGGGILTPACLGEGYAERLRGAGVRLEAEEI